MEQQYFYIIKVLSQGGVWYNNAFIENSYDAIQVARFYRSQLGYVVQLWYKEKDVSFLMEGQEVTFSDVAVIADEQLCPGKPELCPGNVERGGNSCDECDHFLHCFPECADGFIPQ